MVIMHNVQYYFYILDNISLIPSLLFPQSHPNNAGWLPYIISSDMRDSELPVNLVLQGAWGVVPSQKLNIQEQLTY